MMRLLALDPISIEKRSKTPGWRTGKGKAEPLEGWPGGPAQVQGGPKKDSEGGASTKHRPQQATVPSGKRNLSRKVQRSTQPRLCIKSRRRPGSLGTLTGREGSAKGLQKKTSLRPSKGRLTQHVWQHRWAGRSIGTRKAVYFGTGGSLNFRGKRGETLPPAGTKAPGSRSPDSPNDGL